MARYAFTLHINLPAYILFLDLCIDLGLPKGQTRNSTFNTNNWVESAFRTMDTVFLRHRKNKRYGSLAAVIVLANLTRHQD